MGCSTFAELARLAIVFGNDAPRQQAIQVAIDRQQPTPARLAALQLLADHPRPNMLESMLELYNVEEAENLRHAALRVLGKFDSIQVAKAIVQQQFSGRTSSVTLKNLEYELLFSRREWALHWLDAVDRQTIKPDTVTLEQVRRMASLEDEQVNRLVAKHWGKLSGASPEEKLAEVRRLNNDLRAGTGVASSGKQLFKKHCALCHRLHNEGGTVGPDLTSANRKDRDFMLVSLVDPSSVIRKEYLSVIVRTEDDRIFTGIALPSAENGIQLVNAKGETMRLPADEVAEVKPSSVSIMPEDLYKQFTPQELRDLFAYLVEN